MNEIIIKMYPSKSTTLPVKIVSSAQYPDLRDLSYEEQSELGLLDGRRIERMSVTGSMVTIEYAPPMNTRVEFAYPHEKPSATAGSLEEQTGKAKRAKSKSLRTNILGKKKGRW